MFSIGETAMQLNSRVMVAAVALQQEEHNEASHRIGWSFDHRLACERTDGAPDDHGSIKYNHNHNAHGNHDENAS